MFNLKKLLLYYGRILLRLGAVLAAAFILGLLAQIISQKLWECVGATCEPMRLLWWQLAWKPWLLSTALLAVLPALTIMLTLRLMSADFVSAVYGLKNAQEGSSFLWRRLFGMPSFKPYLLVTEGKLPSDKDPLMRIGGPGNMVIHATSAVVLEQNGRLTRVEKVEKNKGGMINLQPFERIWDVVDLRPHRWNYEVSAMTKEGIPVTCQADVTFQIDDDGQTPTQDDLFPATKQAIFYAATRKFMREADRSGDDQIMDWARKAIIGATEGALRAILANYLLDQLLGPVESEWGHYRAEILERLRKELLTSFPDMGLRVTGVELGDIKLDNAIFQQRIEAWQALWKRWTLQRQAEGEAEQLQYVEEAKAQAQADMIVAITQAFQSLTDAEAAIPPQLVLLRMFEVLKRTSYDPQTGILFLPNEIFRAWQTVQDIATGRLTPDEE